MVTTKSIRLIFCCITRILLRVTRNNVSCVSHIRHPSVLTFSYGAHSCCITPLNFHVICLGCLLYISYGSCYLCASWSRARLCFLPYSGYAKLRREVGIIVGQVVCTAWPLDASIISCGCVVADKKASRGSYLRRRVGDSQPDAVTHWKRLFT